MIEHEHAQEFAKDLERRHRIRRAHELARRIEILRAEMLWTSLACTRTGAEARIELRTSIDL